MVECMKKKSTSANPDSQVVKCCKNIVALRYEKKMLELKGALDMADSTCSACKLTIASL
jgi:hypothetical protein